MSAFDPYYILDDDEDTAAPPYSEIELLDYGKT